MKGWVLNVVFVYRECTNTLSFYQVVFFFKKWDYIVSIISTSKISVSERIKFWTPIDADQLKNQSNFKLWGIEFWDGFNIFVLFFYLKIKEEGRILRK